MKPFARFASVKTSEGMRIYRYDTVFHSIKGAGDPIGLVYMLNPGEARPTSDEIFNKLLTSEYLTEELVSTISDRTMNKVIKFIKNAYEINGQKLPNKYTIHVENLFNVREKNSDIAKKLAKANHEHNDLMFRSRELKESYKLVWVAWGKTNIRQLRQSEITKMFPNAIKVHKLNVKGDIRFVKYPVHPLYMKEEFFLEAAAGKI